MQHIKVKKETNKTIKCLNKGKVLAEHLKDNLVKYNKETEDILSNNKDSVNESDKIIYSTNRITHNTVHLLNDYGKKSVYKTKENILRGKEKIKHINNNRRVKKVQKEAIKTAKKVVKETKQASKESRKSAQRAMNLAKKTVKLTVKTTKSIVKGTIKAIKGIIAGTKAIVSAIVAGGWIAVFIIIVISMIALILTSIFGIFFSSENNDGRTMNDVIMEINKELTDKIEAIKKENIYDDFTISYDNADWEEILAIYTVKVNVNNEEEVMTLDNNKIVILKTIFWDMNTFSYEIKQEMIDEEVYENGTLIIKLCSTL